PLKTMSLVPPFTAETAAAKVQKAQDLWNSKNATVVAQAYTEDCIWRNRDTFLRGRDAIVNFLCNKWEKERYYRLRKELFSFNDDRIAVQFWYEFCDKDGQWWRAYGLEHWTFNADGLMKERRSSINDVRIQDGDRWFKNG
ncbi:hypothetical protein DFJ77DRAFT_414870, partial [Powellomyces hirtus]